MSKNGSFGKAGLNVIEDFELIGLDKCGTAYLQLVIIFIRSGPVIKIEIHNLLEGIVSVITCFNKNRKKLTW